MKKIIAVLMLTVGLLAVSMTNAQIIPNEDRQVSLDFDTMLDLATKGIIGWDYEDYIGDNEIYRCLISPTDYNLPCSKRFITYWFNCTEYVNYTEDDIDMEVCISWARINYTLSEKYDILDNWEVERLEGIGQAIRERREHENIEKTREGSVSILGGV